MKNATDNGKASTAAAPQRHGSDERVKRVGGVERAMLAALQGYRYVLSPMLTFVGVRCRHLPSCSEYSAVSIRRHGAWRGFWLTLARLSRCHPFGSHGWDPPPEELAPQGWCAWRYGDWSWRARLAVPSNSDQAVHDPEDKLG